MYRTQSNGKAKDFINGFDLLVRGRMKDDDDGADEADGTPELAQGTESLAKED